MFLFSFFEAKHSSAKKSKYVDVLGKGTKDLLWPNNTIPYERDPAYSSVQIEMIENSLRKIELDTDNCVRFIEITPETSSLYPDYIRLKKEPNVCKSKIGRMGGKQILTLGDFCMWEDSIIHEFVHG